MDRRFNTAKISDDTGVYFFKYPVCNMTLPVSLYMIPSKLENTQRIKSVTRYKMTNY